MKRSFTRTAIVLFAACVTWACGEDLPTSSITELEKIDVVIGTGAEAVNGKTVFVHYTGWIYDEYTADHHGSKFDSSRDPGEPPYNFVLGTGNVIQGWHQGILGMRVGGKRTLIIPPSLAYGSQGSGPIPPNTAIIFDVELMQVQ
jgi:FKBP-type peptidyl-prolyl cis-trans isomerase FkpA